MMCLAWLFGSRIFLCVADGCGICLLGGGIIVSPLERRRTVPDCLHGGIGILVRPVLVLIFVVCASSRLARLCSSFATNARPSLAARRRGRRVGPRLDVAAELGLMLIGVDTGIGVSFWRLVLLIVGFVPGWRCRHRQGSEQRYRSKQEQALEGTPTRDPYPRWGHT